VSQICQQGPAYQLYLEALFRKFARVIRRLFGKSACSYEHSRLRAFRDDRRVQFLDNRPPYGRLGLVLAFDDYLAGGGVNYEIAPFVRYVDNIFYMPIAQLFKNAGTYLLKLKAVYSI